MNRFVYGFLSGILLSILLAGLCLFIFRAPWYTKATPVSEPARTVDYSRLQPVEKAGFFTPDDLKDWTEKKYEDQSRYRIEKDEDGNMVLHGSSEGTSSVILREVHVPLSENLFLSWEWKADVFPQGKTNKKLGARSDNDYAARVYVMFKGITPFHSQAIQYVWDDHFPEGTHAKSGFTKNIQLLVVQSGENGEGGWVRETRNILQDYKLLFGKEPSLPLHAVGFMTDSDNTKSRSEARLKDLELMVSGNPGETA